MSESVPGGSGHLFDTPGTLSGHFLGTPEPGARRAPGTPCRTLPRTPPIFRDTLGDTPGTLRARRARETPVAGRRDRDSKNLKPSKKPLKTLQRPSQRQISISEALSPVAPIHLPLELSPTQVAQTLFGVVCANCPALSSTVPAQNRESQIPRFLEYSGSNFDPPTPLVARIARPTSLTIWHRGCSHRRPNRSGSPNRRHFASLDL